MNGFNGTRQIIDIPGSGGAFLAILATGPVRKVTVQESVTTAAGVANPLQGQLDYLIPNDNTAAGFTQKLSAIGANDETSQGEIVPAEFDLGDDFGDHGPLGSMIGHGPQTLGMGLPPTAATTLCKVRSGTATATSILVTQYY